MDARMDFQHLNGGVSTPDGGFKEALADYARRHWPTHTIKSVERAWDLTTDEAKGLLRGQASLRTVEKVLAHKNGGWRVALPILGGVIGHGLTDYFASEKQRLNHEAEQRRREAVLLGEAESFLHTVDVGTAGPRDRPDMGRSGRAGLALCSS